ncbi:hypothetical protein ACLKA6_000905 [Drosophila palustris]
MPSRSNCKLETRSMDGDDKGDGEEVGSIVAASESQYANGFRPYSSFRVPRSSCSNNNNNNVANRTTNRTTTVNGNSKNSNSSNNNTALSSSCSSSSSLNQQQLVGAGGGVTNGFSRQQPWRSSYCSGNRSLQQLKQQQQEGNNVKPLTPKLIRRIENACASSTNSNSNSCSRYGKPRAPAPPANLARQAKTTANPTISSQKSQAVNQTQKRAYQATNARCAKENCPAAPPCQRTQRSNKNYPAPLPPQQQQQQQRRLHNDLMMETTKTTPLAQRRQLPATPKLSLRQRAVAAAAAQEMEGGASSSSTGSSDSHDSPKLKKAYSKKFPQGLPFEDEFYGYRNRSYSQSSSNYSFYSSVGAATTPQDDDDDDVDNDDEFQRKPSTDEALYVDFSKVVHSHKQQRQYVPASSWIRASPDHEEFEALSGYKNTPLSLTPTQQRRKSAKYARSMHEYLYSDDSTTTTTTTATRTTTTTKTKQRLPALEEPEDGYYSYAAGTPDPPQTPPMPKTDIYVAAASWAPKPLYPDRVLLPHVDTNNNNTSNNKSDHRIQQQQQTRRRSEHLGPTTCEYNFDDSLSSSRRRKERSKRSHRKSPATGRRQHKYRYREETSHSSSRRRHRDRAKDERDSGRNNRQSQAKQFEESQVPCYFKMRELPTKLRRIDNYRDLLLENSSLRFMPYTDDWIVIEYFADHDSDYLVSATKTWHHQLIATGVASELFNIQFFRQLEQQYKRHAQKATPPTSYGNIEDVEDRAEISRCLLLKRQRNLFDLVALCDIPTDRYVGENWIIDEYFIDHRDDYLVTLALRMTSGTS